MKFVIKKAEGVQSFVPFLAAGQLNLLWIAFRNACCLDKASKIIIKGEIITWQEFYRAIHMLNFPGPGWMAQEEFLVTTFMLFRDDPDQGQTLYNIVCENQDYRPPNNNNKSLEYRSIYAEFEAS